MKGQNKSPSIDDYMSNKNTKNEVKNNDIIRNNCNDIIYNYKNNNKSFHYIDKINNIIEECFENEIEGKDCTFTAFVIEAVKTALENIEEERLESKKETSLVK